MTMADDADNGGVLDSIRSEMRRKFGMSDGCDCLEIEQRPPTTPDDETENQTSDS